LKVDFEFMKVELILKTSEKSQTQYRNSTHPFYVNSRFA